MRKKRKKANNRFVLQLKVEAQRLFVFFFWWMRMTMWERLRERSLSADLRDGWKKRHKSLIASEPNEACEQRPASQLGFIAFQALCYQSCTLLAVNKRSILLWSQGFNSCKVTHFTWTTIKTHYCLISESNVCLSRKRSLVKLWLKRFSSCLQICWTFKLTQPLCGLKFPFLIKTWTDHLNTGVERITVSPVWHHVVGTVPLKHRF